MTEELYVYDKISGHFFCKYCGRNYLGQEHNPDCKSLQPNDDSLPTRLEGSE